MALFYNLKKKSLQVKLKKAEAKAKKLSSIRKKEAKQQRDLEKLQKQIKQASVLKLSKADRDALKRMGEARRKKFMKAKGQAKEIASTGYKFAVKLGKFIDKNVGKPRVRRKARRKR